MPRGTELITLSGQSANELQNTVKKLAGCKRATKSENLPPKVAGF
jgi:hypothetical protein